MKLRYFFDCTARDDRWKQNQCIIFSSLSLLLASPISHPNNNKTKKMTKPKCPLHKVKKQQPSLTGKTHTKEWGRDMNNHNYTLFKDNDWQKMQVNWTMSQKTQWLPPKCVVLLTLQRGLSETSNTVQIVTSTQMEFFPISSVLASDLTQGSMTNMPLWMFLTCVTTYTYRWYDRNSQCNALTEH